MYLLDRVSPSVWHLVETVMIPCMNPFGSRSHGVCNSCSLIFPYHGL